MRRTSSLRRILLIGLWLASTPLAAAPTTSFTLAKIRNYGAIYVGYGESNFPFSFLDAGGKPAGYSVDLCRHLVDAIRARLGVADLALVAVPVSAGAVQILFEAATLDLHCGALANTRQRQRSVAFSVTTFASGIKALVRKDSDSRIGRLGDLRGQVIVSTAGTNLEAHVRAAASRQGWAASYRLGRDPDDSLRQLINGQADALALDEVGLHALLRQLPDDAAHTLRIVDGYFAVEPYAIVLRRDDPQFKKLVDDTLSGLMTSGEFARLYEKWFMRPIAPLDKSLELPMSDLLKQLMRTPNDRGI